MGTEGNSFQYNCKTLLKGQAETLSAKLILQSGLVVEIVKNQGDKAIFVSLKLFSSWSSLSTYN